MTKLRSVRSIWLTGGVHESWVCTLPMRFCRGAGLQPGDVIECTWEEGSDTITIKVKKASD